MNPKIQYPVGRRICELRHRQRITQEELTACLQALHAPITRNVIANWETGRDDVPAYCIQLIAYSLGVKVADILPDLSFDEMIVDQTMETSGSRRQNCQPT